MDIRTGLGLILGALLYLCYEATIIRKTLTRLEMLAKYRISVKAATKQ